MLIQHMCLRIALEEKDYMMLEELDEVRAYAKKNGIRLSGKNLHPQFIKYGVNWRMLKRHCLKDLLWRC